MLNKKGMSSIRHPHEILKTNKYLKHYEITISSFFEDAWNMYPLSYSFSSKSSVTLSSKLSWIYFFIGLAPYFFSFIAFAWITFIASSSHSIE